MANIRTKANGRGAARMTLTTAFMTDVGSIAPKGAAATFRAPRNAIEMFSNKPAKVKALLRGCGEAIAERRKEGHTVSLRVEVRSFGRCNCDADRDNCGRMRRLR